MQASRILVLLLCSLTIAACKVQVVVPENGYIRAETTAQDCPALSTCPVDVVDLFFDENYIAIPNEGYYFSGWKTRDNNLCGGSREPCHLYTSDFSGNDVLMAFLESDEVFYLEPIFKKASDSSCSFYASDDIFCVDGHYPTCSVSEQQINELSVGMTYDEAIARLGCHGVPVAMSGPEVAIYAWGG